MQKMLKVLENMKGKCIDNIKLEEDFLNNIQELRQWSITFTTDPLYNY